MSKWTQLNSFACKIPFYAIFIVVLVSAACKKERLERLAPRIATKDSIIFKDSVILVYDTISIADSITILDTLYHTDTISIIDTIRVIDTIRKIDTIRVIDSIRIIDTSKVVDTIQIIDTIRIIDTIKVYDTIRITLPPTPTIDDALLVGTGSGNLQINAQTLQGQTTSTIRIKSGTYESIVISGINGTPSNPITITNEGQVVVRFVMETWDVSNLTITGEGSNGIEYGISFEDLSFRAIKMSGKMSGVTIKNIRFKNVPDYCISGEHNNGNGLRHDGTSNTRTERFKILNCLFDNAGSVVFGGSLSSSGDTGFYKDVEIAYNVFKNTDAGSLCIFSNVQDYDIHHNVVEHVNQQNNNHNGIFFMQGNGRFHDNKLTDYQGNALRAWAYSRGTTPALVSIYNNICYQTRKYSGFEIQQFDANFVAGVSTYVNAKVYNNTVGKMNTSKDWEGQILDLYQLSGTLEYYNNLGFELFSSNTYNPISDMINNMSSTKITVKSNNLYFSQQSGAVYDNLGSKHNGIGATLEL